ncbi:hypothetical protein ETAA8_08010 [Anatilimnocola aggregata]|uniref:Uncharacterized protein n=1 Tax=Anatilimnocola aggregata TaxID=2528021 RepID=A0A517Y670_9BACT|nr:hypothetical protein [Anatilimnocola aggregata]QDU25731.1 hypothetical protein ETAA8_08010 [Anatilimnocola aggregata]
MAPLEPEEYIEQAYLFRALAERLPENHTVQDLLGQVKQELLSTTRLPLAIDFLLAEIKHAGTMASAMARLPHYFTPFQTYVIREAEAETGRFDMRIAVDILQHEAEYRSKSPRPQGLFMYQLECLCRNRLKYDPGLTAMAQDPVFDERWQSWISIVRAQMGLVDFGELIYVRSEYYWQARAKFDETPPADKPVLFDVKEGKIAWANRRKDPVYLFLAFQRHLGYPAVPRPKKIDQAPNLLPQLQAKIDRLETRLKLLEEDTKGGIDISKFYGPQPGG